jgi:hypothetical protein
VTPRRFVAGVRADLHQRRWLRWHCFLIGTLTLLTAWLASHTLMRLGSEALWLRYGMAFAVAYAVFVVLLYAWARWLLSRDQADATRADGGWGGGDGAAAPGGGNASGGVPFRSGGGGDFGGAGAGGSFDAPASEALAETAGGALELAGAADEAAIVLLPLAVVAALAAGLAVVFGFVVFGLFGVEVLLTVAVEVALASIGGALAYKAGREGWLRAAWRRTRGPAACALVALMGVGAAIDAWMPQANSLPAAVRLLRSH